MTLWLLRPLLNTTEDFAEDCNHGFVIRAETEAEARQLASKIFGMETNFDFGGAGARVQDSPWLHPDQTKCSELTPNGPSEVVIRDFRASSYEPEQYENGGLTPMGV